MQPAKLLHVSEAEYLTGEALSQIKHEYLDGHVYAMSGGTRNHAEIAGNVFGLLHTHLRGRPCRVFNSDLKVHIAEYNRYYYPDVTVTCDARDLAPPGTGQFIEHPSVIVEVLSPTTESTDRREKLLAYQTLPSVQEYVLIDQMRPWIEVFRRVPDGWLHETQAEDGALHLQSVDLRASLADIYANVEFPPPPDPLPQ